LLAKVSKIKRNKWTSSEGFIYDIQKTNS